MPSHANDLGTLTGDTKSYSKRVCLTFRDGSTEMDDGEYAPVFNLSKLWAARI